MKHSMKKSNVIYMIFIDSVNNLQTDFTSYRIFEIKVIYSLH